MAFNFEQLEDRKLLAVAISGTSTLNIVSDNSSDLVVVVPGGGGLQVQVNGGALQGPFLGATSVRFTGNGGNDIFGVNGLNLSGSLTANTGAGNDAVVVFNSVINGTTNVNLGSEDNQMQVSANSQLIGNVLVTGGAGSDLINTLNQAAIRSQGNVTINTAGGNDRIGNAVAAGINASGVRAVGNVTINTGEGNDFVRVLGVRGNLRITTGNGNDQVAVGSGAADPDPINVNGGTASIDTGGGNDQVGIAFASFSGTVNIRTGTGSDLVGIANSSFASRVTVDLGDDNDPDNFVNGPGNTYLGGLVVNNQP